MDRSNRDGSDSIRHAPHQCSGCVENRTSWKPRVRNCGKTIKPRQPKIQLIYRINFLHTPPLHGRGHPTPCPPSPPPSPPSTTSSTASPLPPSPTSPPPPPGRWTLHPRGFPSATPARPTRRHEWSMDARQTRRCAVRGLAGRRDLRGRGHRLDPVTAGRRLPVFVAPGRRGGRRASRPMPR
jgi:hypothetical protein